MKTFYGLWVFWAFLLLLGTSCDTTKPQVTDDAIKIPSIDHAKFTEGCPECHEQNRYPPNVDLVTTPHGFGGDCVQCHSFPAFATIKPNVLAHNPYPASCLGCHSIATEAPPHGPQGNCGNAGCHSFPDWSVLGGQPP